ncbi:MAG: sigma-70 family RNA polymerase sigma factor [Gemmatimonadaceae bacterium]
MPPAAVLPFAARCALSSATGMQYVGVGIIRPHYSRRRPDFGLYAPPVNESGTPLHEDQKLVMAMARSDERAAAQFYDKYSAAMFALAMRIVGESADAEDVVLDAFTQAWNSAARYDGERGSVLGWLTTMTRTRALDLVRGRGRRTKAVDSASRSMGDDPVAVAAAAPSAVDVVEMGERAEAVTSAMGILSGLQRNAIELAFFEGLTHSEIADRLGEPLGTIKTRIRLGMQKLRDVLRDTPQEMMS